MDRQIVYPGSIPLDTDFLSIQRNAFAAVGSLAKLVLGSAPVLDGFVCTPGQQYTVSIGPGSLSMQMALDASGFGSLLTDPLPIVKTGVNEGAVSLTLGTTADQSSALCWLIQATLQETDDTPIALQYWNAGNPTIPYSGPNNSGAAQNTRRHLSVVFSSKSSSPVPVGTFALPDPDPGYVGLYGITTWIGKGQITADDIVALPSAPMLQYRLPDLTPGFSRSVVITASSNWAVPAGVRRLRVRLVGAGGGGGGGTPAFGGGGGGAGGYAESIFLVSPGQSIPVVIGAGGSGAAPNATGGSGGATQFGSFAGAQGGAGGGSANPDSRGGQGGVGSAGVLLLAGGMGTDGASVAGVPAGNGGASAFGGGGRGANSGGLPANGMAPGSGAGGAYGLTSAGGAGAPGIVVVEF